MRRLVVLLAVLVPVSLFIAGCGGSGGGGTGAKGPDPTKSKEAMEQFTKDRAADMQKAKSGMKTPPQAPQK